MDSILILDFGSQYTQLIARKVRELNVYCEIHPFNKIPTLTEDVKGVIFSGSPYSCNGCRCWRCATVRSISPNGAAVRCSSRG